MYPAPPYNIDRNPFSKGNEILAAILLCLLQLLLMLSLTVLFLSSKSLAEATFLKWSFLGDYIPIIRRFSAIFGSQGNLVELHRAFAIYLSYVMLQAIVFPLILLLFVRGADFNRRRRISLKENLAFFFFVSLAAVPSILMFFGEYDLANPAYYSNNLTRGDYWSAYFEFCVFVPLGNLVIYISLFMRY